MRPLERSSCRSSSAVTVPAAAGATAGAGRCAAAGATAASAAAAAAAVAADAAAPVRGRLTPCSAAPAAAGGGRIPAGGGVGDFRFLPPAAASACDSAQAGVRKHFRLQSQIHMPPDTQTPCSFHAPGKPCCLASNSDPPTASGSARRRRAHSCCPQRGLGGGLAGLGRAAGLPCRAALPCGPCHAV